MSFIPKLKPPFVQRMRLPEENMAPYRDGYICVTCQRTTFDVLLSHYGHNIETLSQPVASIENSCIMCKLAKDKQTGEALPWEINTLFEPSFRLGERGTRASLKIGPRRSVVIPTLEYCADLAKKWIEKSSGQTDESINNPRDLPKRVVDVSGSTILLRDFSSVPLGDPSRQGLYIALSHRWGPLETMVRTLKSTLLIMMTGIDFSKLSLGFQEAIELTRLLGVNYIWIDCLCIIQDSEEDWNEESAKMNTYYCLSWLTIAIGLESSQGCIPKRQGRQQNIYRIVTQDDVLYLEHTNRPSIGSSASRNSILHNRGWAYQEELLSPRYLCFLAEQLIFRCGNMEFNEDSYSFWTDQFPTLTKGDWENIVNGYSRRDLTGAEDRLPALSGIAHEYHKRWSGDYLAGLWRGDFMSQLLWECNFPRKSKSPGYRAPSWSWASINGGVSYRFSPDENLFTLDIQHVCTELDGTDPMGKLKGGSLTARGFIRTGIVTIPSGYYQSPGSWKQLPCISSFLKNAPDEWDDKAFFDFKIVISFDDKIWEVENFVVFLLDVTERKSLVLQLAPRNHPQWRENTYERIGIAWKSYTRSYGPLARRMAVVEGDYQPEGMELEAPMRLEARRQREADKLRYKALSHWEEVHII
ncbi:hypothetical protein NHQ30_006206 [Ciborinia camelliae]|nr:hypothetical protein NHQ30_006206 [Ciborinia camelliae]